MSGNSEANRVQDKVDISSCLWTKKLEINIHVLGIDLVLQISDTCVSFRYQLSTAHTALEIIMNCSVVDGFDGG